MKPALDSGRLARVYRRVASRYDVQHALLTAGSDQRGRRAVVQGTVNAGDRVIDCGAGTGATALLAAEQTGPEGYVTLYDLSEAMLAEARDKMKSAVCPVTFQTGDMTALPFPDDSFEVALSTYSLCPLYDPEKGALEMYRVVRPGGRLGIAHSAEPDNPFVGMLARGVEAIVWRLPTISLGCRPVSVIAALQRAGGRVVFSRQVGVPLWPFAVFVIEKPDKTV